VIVKTVLRHQKTDGEPEESFKIGSTPSIGWRVAVPG
jgi:hypothetical protein